MLCVSLCLHSLTVYVFIFAIVKCCPGIGLGYFLLYVFGVVFCFFFFCLFFFFVLFFFFKQKTAYEIRPRDWSSDVCSSDLNCDFWPDAGSNHRRSRVLIGIKNNHRLYAGIAAVQQRRIFLFRTLGIIEQRSEERRVGKECRYRWSPYHQHTRQIHTPLTHITNSLQDSGAQIC